MLDLLRLPQQIGSVGYADRAPARKRSLATAVSEQAGAGWRRKRAPARSA